jgi:hypothetical protein
MRRFQLPYFCSVKAKEFAKARDNAMGKDRSAAATKEKLARHADAVIRIRSIYLMIRRDDA